MATSEQGKAGGEARKEQLGHEGYSELGKKGAAARWGKSEDEAGATEGSKDETSDQIPCSECDFMAKDNRGLASHSRQKHPDVSQ